jgi:hypothetical protein
MALALCSSNRGEVMPTCPNCDHTWQEGAGWPEECREERCNYYTHYLRYSKPGEPDMPHAAYHAVEKECDEVQKELEAHQRRLEVSGHWVAEQRGLEARALRLEKEVRA